MTRRLSRRKLIGTLGALGVAVPCLTAADKAEVMPGDVKLTDLQVGGLTTTEAKSTSQNISPDGHAFTMLMDNLRVEAGGKAPIYASRAMRLTGKLTTAPGDPRHIGYSFAVRGYAQKGKRSRVALVADLNGEFRTWEVGYDQEFADNFVLSGFVPAPRMLSAGTVPPATAMGVTLLLVAEALTSEDGALLTVDALDGESLFSLAPMANPRAKQGKK